MIKMIYQTKSNDKQQQKTRKYHIVKKLQNLMSHFYMIVHYPGLVQAFQ